MRVRVLIAASLALVALAALPAPASAKAGQIVPGTSIDGVKIGMRRGVIFGRHHRQVTTVRSIEGSPQEVHSLDSQDGAAVLQGKRVYLATYTDDEIGVYFQMRNKTGKLDRKRDAYDKVVGVATGSRRYKGRVSVGQTFNAPDSDCAPADARVAPGGGPRRVVACEADFAGGNTPGLDILYFAAGVADRAGQTVNQYAIFGPGVEQAVWFALRNGALMDLGCTDFECSSLG
jgi:hypothetical protein